MTVAEFEVIAAREKSSAELLRAAALLWLDSRDLLLSWLSVEDNEWPEDTGGKHATSELKTMKRLMKVMKYHTESLATGFDRDAIIEIVLAEQARLHGYTTEINWSVRFDSEGAGQ